MDLLILVGMCILALIALFAAGALFGAIFAVVENFIKFTEE